MLARIKSFIRNDDPQTRIKWSLYGRAWREIGLPYWKWLAAGVVFTVIAAGAEAFSITLIKGIVDQGFIEKNVDSLYFIGLQVIGAFSAKSAFHYARTLVMTRAGLLGATNLRRRVYRHMVRQDIGYFHGSRIGTLMNYFGGLAGAVLGLVTDNVIGIVQNVATLAMMLALMLWYAPQMTAVLLFLVPGILVPLTLITRKRRALLRHSFRTDAGSLSHISQSILGIRTIQAFVMEGAEARNMDDIEDFRIKVSSKNAKISGLQTPLLEIMISIGLCFSLIIGGHLITSGGISVGDFVAFVLALTAAYKPARAITGIGSGIQGGLVAAGELFAFLDRKPEIEDAPDAAELERGPMAIRLEHIRFAYNSADGDVLHDISLEVAPGRIYAFVGPSGGGKSTIFNLLQRFYDPREGRVSINGTDIRKFTLASLRANMASVSQDVFLFSGTIADNIRYGSPGASLEEVAAAARAANAHEFIMDFPSQYENQVGERGTLLSGGQKQRLAIARAILKDAPILLLDEATSALDSRSEELIQAALKTLMRGRTTFVIAHRLATVLDADTICVVKEGRIIEQGPDAELVKLDGEYKKLKDIQFRDNQDNEGENGIS
jgi:subfamily B ATP-binding cassette protein MsbA